MAKNYDIDRYKMDSTYRGFYSPSFFKLGINTLERLDNPTELDKSNLATFFHEYIHFLQDLTTSFGLMNTSIIVDRMKYYNTDVISKGNETFDVPYELAEKFSLSINSKLQKLYIGDKQLEVERIVKVDVKEKDSDIMLPEPYNKFATYIELSYKTENEIEKRINFGAHCVMESMAHLGQNFIYPVEHNSIPYKTAKMVAENTYKVIGDNDLYVFALCDACLMTYQPGVFFFRVLQKMKEENYLPSNEYEVYGYLLTYWKAEKIHLLFHFSWLSGFSNHQLLGYFTTSIYENEKVWINALLKNAHDLRVNNPFFLIDLVKHGTDFTSSLKDLLSELGTPLMMNSNEESAFIPPSTCAGLDIKPERLSAIFEIFRLFEFGRLKCELIKYCSLKETDLVDERCDNPWARVNDDNLCAYAKQWRAWGLSDFIPIKE